MTRPKPLYWDSCVFIRYITQSPREICADLDQYIAQAKKGEVQINFSTIVFAEILPKYLKNSRHASIYEFFRSLGRNFIPHDVNPNIALLAGALRDSPARNPDPSSNLVRVLGTPDAVHLATCIYLEEAAGLTGIEFHTLDEGKGKTWEGKCVPLLGFERWYPPELRTEAITKACNLSRRKPIHPEPDLVTGSAINAPAISEQRH